MSKYLLTILTLLGIGFILSRETVVRTIQTSNGTDDNPGNKLTIVVAIGNIGSQMWLETRHAATELENEGKK